MQSSPSWLCCVPMYTGLQGEKPSGWQCFCYKLLAFTNFYSATHLCWPWHEVPNSAQTDRINTSRLFLLQCWGEAWSSWGVKMTGIEGHRDESVRGGAERKRGRKVSGCKNKQTMVTLKKKNRSCIYDHLSGAKAYTGVINKASRSMCTCLKPEAPAAEVQLWGFV